MTATIIYDSRERDLHIIKELERRGIQCVRRKLDFADYSFEIDGVSYEKKIAIERKKSLSELIGNFTKGSKRFRAEFERSRGCEVHLMIESSQKELNNGQYRSEMAPCDVNRFIKTWSNKYMFHVVFTDRKEAAETVLNIFRQFLIKERGMQKNE